MKKNKVIVNDDLLRLVVLLRYGTYNPTIQSKPILNIKVIAQTLKISSYYVNKLLGV
jgi:hypothetical protein